MSENLQVLEHFHSTDDLESAIDVLSGAGLHPAVEEEARGGTDGAGGVYALLVPDTELEDAERLLEDWASERGYYAAFEGTE